MLINGFNDACNIIDTSYMKVGDESMSAIRFQMTAKGDLPHLSCILRKPDPLGTDFRTVACSVTWALLLIELQRRKEGTKQSNYRKHIGLTAACTKMIM